MVVMAIYSSYEVVMVIYIVVMTIYSGYSLNVEAYLQLELYRLA